MYHTIIWICPSVCPFRNYSAVSRPIATKQERMSHLYYKTDRGVQECLGHHTIRRQSVCMHESQGGSPIGKALVIGNNWNWLLWIRRSKSCRFSFMSSFAMALHFFTQYREYDEHSLIPQPGSPFTLFYVYACAVQKSCKTVTGWA